MLSLVNRSRRNELFCFGIMVLTIPACDVEPGQGELAEDVVGEAIPEEVLPQENAVVLTSDVDRSRPAPLIVEFDVGDEAHIRMFDVGDGDIGIVEARSTRRSSWLAKMIQETDATPLELYLAMDGKDKTAIAQLGDHHQRVATSAARDLKAHVLEPRSSHDLEVNGYHDGHLICNKTNWDVAWANDVGPVSAVDQADFETQSDSVTTDSVTFYPGTANNSKTWLGVCADDQGGSTGGGGCSAPAYDDRRFAVDKLISGTWTEQFNLFVDAKKWGTACGVGYDESAYTFYNSTISGARFRGRFYPDDSGVCGNCYLESFGWAVAYNSISIEG